MKRKTFFRKGNYVLTLAILTMIIVFSAVAIVYGGIKTVTGSCGSPQNKMQYEVGEMMYIMCDSGDCYIGTQNWVISGVCGPDKDNTIASGKVSLDAEGNCKYCLAPCAAPGDPNTACENTDSDPRTYCFPAYQLQSGNEGVYKSNTDHDASDNFKVVGAAPPTLTIVKSDNEPVALGGNIIYTLTVTNTSQTPASNVSVEDVIPEGIACANVDAIGDGWNCGKAFDSTLNSCVVTCNLTSPSPLPGNNTSANNIFITLANPGAGTYENSTCAFIERTFQGCDLETTTIQQPPTPTTVPTMTEWGMIIFIILTGVGSIYYLRRQRRTR